MRHAKKSLAAKFMIFIFTRCLARLLTRKRDITCAGPPKALLFDSFANRSIVLALFNTWGFDMDDVKAVIPQAIDEIGTPPEAPAEAPKPETSTRPEAPGA